MDFLSVIFEFVESQGEKVVPTRSATRTCAASGQMASVDEKPVLCTARSCVDEMTFAPQGVQQDIPATKDRMLVPVSGYALSEHGRHHSLQEDRGGGIHIRRPHTKLDQHGEYWSSQDSVDSS